MGGRYYPEGATNPVSQTEPNPDNSANAAAIVLAEAMRQRRGMLNAER